MYSSRAALLITGAVVGLSVTPASVAYADSTTYLINVTVRPGYHFAGPEDAVAYGQHICGKLAAGQGYPSLMRDVATDLATTDQYQASYLIAQAVNELCPESIWLLRNSAAHYRPETP